MWPKLSEELGKVWAEATVPFVDPTEMSISTILTDFDNL